MEISFKESDIKFSRITLYKTKVSYGKIFVLSFRYNKDNDTYYMHTAYTTSLLSGFDKKKTKNLQVDIIYNKRDRCIEFRFGDEVFRVSCLLFYVKNNFTFMNNGKSYITAHLSYNGETYNYSNANVTNFNKVVHLMNDKLKELINY